MRNNGAFFVSIPCHILKSPQSHCLPFSSPHLPELLSSEETSLQSTAKDISIIHLIYRMTLPPGPTAVIATQAVFLFLSYVFVSARFYSRYFIVKKVDWDDFFLLLTLAFYTCFASFIITVGSVHEYQYAINPLNPLA